MSTEQPPSLDEIHFGAGMYLKEFFARKRVLTGLLGAGAMLVLLATLHSSLVFQLVIAALTGVFIYTNVKALRLYVRRRYILDLTAAGDREQWRQLEPGILPTQSFLQAMRRVGAYGVFMITVGTIGGPIIVLNAASPVELINGVAVFFAAWLYAVSDAYERSTDIFSNEELREMFQEAWAQIDAQTVSQEQVH